MALDTIRINTRVSTEINKFLEEESFKTGLPKSTLIYMALDQYMTQQRSIKALEANQGTLKQLFEKVEAIEKKLNQQ